MLLFALDLTYRYYSKVSRGAIRVTGTWVKLAGEPQQPCLVLQDANVKSGTHPPFIILMNNVWSWMEELNDDPMDIARRAADAVTTMNRSLTNPEMFNVIDAVRDAVDDLIKSDLWAPVTKPLVIGEATMTDLNTGKTTEDDVRILH